MIGNARKPDDWPSLPRQCRHRDGTPKAVFRTERDALLRRRVHDRRKDLQAYHCDTCAGWHLGHKPARLED